MATKMKIQSEDGKKSVVHFNSAHTDHSLCGSDLDGDDGYCHGEPTEDRVDCEDCIAIVRLCRSINQREYMIDSRKQKRTHLDW